MTFDSAPALGVLLSALTGAGTVAARLWVLGNRKRAEHERALRAAARTDRDVATALRDELRQDLVDLKRELRDIQALLHTCEARNLELALRVQVLEVSRGGGTA